MNILHIHRTDNYRSAGGVMMMYRLHLGLKEAGLDSRLLCASHTTNSPDVIRIPRPKKVEALLRKITAPLGLNDIHAISSFGIRKHPAYLRADIIHIHGIHSNFFSYLALPWLTQTKPTVFTLHDMWAMTGHCAFSYDCERWRTGCGTCPYPDTHPAIRRDSTRVEWKLKQWVYSRSNLSIVSPSSTVARQARQSMLNRFPIHHISYGIDTNVYRPLDREQSRTRLGIPPGKRVLMFAAVKLNHFRKGGDLLIKALQHLPESVKATTLLLLMGGEGSAITEATGMQTVDLGYVRDEPLKVRAYSAADLFVSPTRGETFGLVLLESMACGTPLVSFRVGGVSDLVRPGVTGYLAEPESAQELSNGILQLLENVAMRESMSRRCRSIAVEEFSLELYVRRHIELYQQLLSNPLSSQCTLSMIQA